MRAALAPVADALHVRARARAHEELVRSEEDARAVVMRAREQAARMVSDAKAEGLAAAERSASTQLALARRAARAMVLAAHRRAYDELRSAALDELLARSTTREGRMLAERMRALVRERLGGATPIRMVALGTFEVAAESGNRLASMEPSALIDEVLASRADEINALWR